MMTKTQVLTENNCRVKGCFRISFFFTSNAFLNFVYELTEICKGLVWYEYSRSGEKILTTTTIKGIQEGLT